MSSQNSVTRKAGGRKEVEKEMQVHFFTLCYRFISPLLAEPVCLRILNLSGHSGHEGVHEQPPKCSPPERHAHNTRDVGSWGLYPFSTNMRGEKEYPRSFYEFHIWSSLSPSGNNGSLL